MTKEERNKLDIKNTYLEQKRAMEEQRIADAFFWKTIRRRMLTTEKTKKEVVEDIKQEAFDVA